MKKKNWLIVVIDIILIAILYYVTLPPLNLSSPSFWTFLLFALIIICGSLIIKSSSGLRHYYNPDIFKICKYFGLITISIFLIVFLINVFSSPLFNAKEYSKRIQIDETGDFIKDVKPIDFNQIPLLDKDSSEKLGDRKMGELGEPILCK